MITKKCIYSTIAAFAVLFIADYLWFGVIFKSYLESAMPSTGENSVGLHALGELCLAGLLAWIYPFGFKGGSTISEGLKFGLMMGLVYQLPGTIHWYASMGGEIGHFVLFIVNGIVIGLLGGVTVASVYGKAPAA